MTRSPEQEPEDLQRPDVPVPAEQAPTEFVLDPDQQASLHRLLTVMYPHPTFPEGPYRRTAEAILQADKAEEILPAGLADLDAAADGAYAEADEQSATLIAEKLADSPLIALVHSTAVVALYDDHEVWELLGYEGASFDKGGYLHRGFDDLDWLPDPRVEEYDGEPRPELITAGDE